MEVQVVYHDYQLISLCVFIFIPLYFSWLIGFNFSKPNIHLLVYPMTLLVKSSTNGKRWGMTLLVGMCGTTMVFKAALAERCWNGWNGGCWWPERCRWLIVFSRRCLWARLVKSGYGWKVNGFALLQMCIQCKYNVHMFFLTFICIYIWFLCGYHVIHNIYIYIYIIIYVYIDIFIFIFLCI